MHHRETIAPVSIEALASAEIKASRGSVATAEGKARFPTGQQRKWLHVDAKGTLTCVAADKHTLVCTLGIPLRDLRILDPLVGSFGKHLCQRVRPKHAVAAFLIASSRSNCTMMSYTRAVSDHCRSPAHTPHASSSEKKPCSSAWRGYA